MPFRARPRSHLQSYFRSYFRPRSRRTLLTDLVQLVSHLVALLLLARMTLRLIANFRFLHAAERIPSLTASYLPRVSVLIPARDEAGAITACVASLMSQQYANMEILVLDDGSTDGTSQLLDALANQSQRPHSSLTVIHSTGDPPPGWNGKSYACHRLAQRATGEWLLFTDADTLHTPTSVARGVTLALALQTDLLSAFPRQRAETWSERLLVSFIMDFLPLSAVNLTALRRGDSEYSGRPLANGQYLLVRTDTYRALGGHAAIAQALVDDFALARLVRSTGYSVAMVDGSPMLACRMYRSSREVWDGFSKNLLIALAPAADSPAEGSVAPTVRGALANPLHASLRALLFAWGYACIFVLPFVRLLRPGRRPIARPLAALEVCWLLLLRSLVARRLRRPADEIITTPCAAWGVMVISLSALVRRWRKRPIVWKRRRYSSPLS